MPTPKPPRKKPLPARRVSRKPVKPTPPLPENRNTRAVSHGASANGKFLPGYEETRAEVQAAIDAAGWLQPTDTIVLDIFCSELNAYRFTARALARMSDVAAMKKLRAAGLQVSRGRLLLDMANKMGFTAEGRYRLGLTAVKIQRAKEGAKPVRNESRARDVALMLQRAGALPPIDAEGRVVAESVVTDEVVPEPKVFEDPDPPEAPEQIFFRPGGGHTG